MKLAAVLTAVTLCAITNLAHADRPADSGDGKIVGIPGTISYLNNIHNTDVCLLRESDPALCRDKAMLSEEAFNKEVALMTKIKKDSAKRTKTAELGGPMGASPKLNCVETKCLGILKGGLSPSVDEYHDCVNRCFGF